MERRQKSAIRKYQRRLAEELILDEEFYAALRQKKLFNDSMIANIRAKLTETDRVYYMLQLLTRRGPEAFDKFVEVLRENFKWLADMLEHGYNEMCQTEHAHNFNDDEQTTKKLVSINDRADAHDEPTKHMQMRQTYSAQYRELLATTTQEGPDTPPYTPATPWNNLSLSLNFSFDNAHMLTNHANTQRSETPGQSCASPKKTVNIQINPRGIIRSDTSTDYTLQTSHQSHSDTGTDQDTSDSDTDSDKDTSESEDDASDGCPSIMQYRKAAAAKRIQEKNRLSCNVDQSYNEKDQLNKSESAHDFCDTGIPSDKHSMEKTAEQPDIDYSYRSECKENMDNTQTSLEQQSQLMQEMYRKLKNFIKKSKSNKNNATEQCSNDTTDTELETDVSLEMIDDLIDEITDMPFHDHEVMIAKSYKLLGKRDQRLPLEVGIKRLKEEIQDLEMKLFLEEEKSNKMVDDMYILSEEKKKLEKKCRDNQADALKEQCMVLEEKNEELSRRITDLEIQIRILQRYKDMVAVQENNDIRKEEKRHGKRLGSSVKKLPLAQASRRPGAYPSLERGMSFIRSSQQQRQPARGHSSIVRSKRP